MKRQLNTTLGLLALAVILAAPCSAGVILIGTLPGPAANSFPFGNTDGSIYQQVYAAGNFAGPVTIVGITFFNSDSAGSFAAGTYAFSLSTTPAPVDGLDTSDLDTNVGTDNQAFASVGLSGSVGTQFTITGTPFFYDPVQGNLLVDIRTTYSESQSGSVYLDSFTLTEPTNGLTSRAHNYGSGFAGYGLITQFETLDEGAVPEPSTLALVGAGMLLVLLRRRT